VDVHDAYATWWAHAAPAIPPQQYRAAQKQACPVDVHDAYATWWARRDKRPMHSEEKRRKWRDRQRFCRDRQQKKRDGEVAACKDDPVLLMNLRRRRAEERQQRRAAQKQACPMDVHDAYATWWAHDAPAIPPQQYRAAQKQASPVDVHDAYATWWVQHAQLQLAGLCAHHAPAGAAAATVAAHVGSWAAGQTPPPETGAAHGLPRPSSAPPVPEPMRRGDDAGLW